MDVVGDLEEIIFALSVSEEKYYFIIPILFLYLNCQFQRLTVTVPEAYSQDRIHCDLTQITAMFV